MTIKAFLEILMLFREIGVGQLEADLLTGWLHVPYPAQDVEPVFFI
jgi:hypothetical protein